MSYGSVFKAYSVAPGFYRTICPGPKGTLLVAGHYQSLLQLQLDEKARKLHLVRQVQLLPFGKIEHMCYVAKNDLVILSSYCRITAVKLDTGAKEAKPVWQLMGLVNGRQIDPQGITSDGKGRVFVADGDNSRILVLEASSGEVLQILLDDKHLGKVFDVCCLGQAGQPDQILLKHEPSNASLYNIHHSDDLSQTVYYI